MSGKDVQKKSLEQIGKEFLQVVESEVDSCIFLGDREKLRGLIRSVRVFIDAQLVMNLREKGLGDELRLLCKKAGEMKRK
jgi:hypothetical protein